MSMTLLPPSAVIRADGSRVKLRAQSTLREEINGFLALLRDWRMLALLPMVCFRLLSGWSLR
jgi:hypothetical protein